MKIEFKKSFLSDIKKLKSKSLKDSVTDCIKQVEFSINLRQIKNLKNLTGYDKYYRI